MEAETGAAGAPAPALAVAVEAAAAETEYGTVESISLVDVVLDGTEPRTTMVSSRFSTSWIWYNVEILPSNSTIF